MVDSRDKGARAELKVRDDMRSLTGLKWERVPGSGALHEKHGLKGDLYLVGSHNHYCVEVKHYTSCHINHLLINGTSPQLLEWWQQALRQAKQVNKKPLLIFKHDRSKLYAAYLDIPSCEYNYIYINKDGYSFVISLLEDYIRFEKPEFT